MSIFVMPSLGADMEAGTLVEQLIAAGEPVRHGDVIAAVETQKGVIEIEAFEDGLLQDWLVEIGTQVPVGAPLALIRAPGEAALAVPEAPVPTQPASPKMPIPEETQADPAPQVVAQTQPTPATETPQQGLRASPAARRLASQKGIDISKVSAGADGIITRADVEGFSDTDTATAGPGTTSATPDMRSAIAAAMSRAKREIPHYYLSHQIDLTAADQFLRRENADRPPADRLLMSALFAKATAKALAKFPEFNGHYADGIFTPKDAVHLGIAIHIRSGGLVAPALFDTQSRPLDGLMSDLRDLVTRVREGRFRARELSEATITLTNMGERGVDQLFGVIYPPQVAIVGLGTPRLCPMVHDGKVAARLGCTCTLSADHRVSDGHRGALFLRAIDKHLQHLEGLNK